MDPTVSNNFNNFCDMILSSEHEQNNFEENFCNFYLENDSLEEQGQEEDEKEDDDEMDFESSQLHQLIHTQPIHLINYQMLSDHNFREENLPAPTSIKSDLSDDFTNLEDSSENVFHVFDSGNLTKDNTAATSATSAHFKHNLVEPAPEKWTYWKEQISIPSFYEHMDTIIRSDSNSPDILNSTHDLDWEVPRSLPIEYRDPGQYVNFSQYFNFQDEPAIPVPSLQLQEPHQSKNCRDNNNTNNNNYNYNYRIKTDTSSSMNRRPTEGENSFVRTLNSKLSRYTGYFGAGSRDQEYYDKVRFQEISYKFSKTYF